MSDSALASVSPRSSLRWLYTVQVTIHYNTISIHTLIYIYTEDIVCDMLMGLYQMMCVVYCNNVLALYR